MSIKPTIYFILLFSLPISLVAQSVFEGLGGVKTHYTILSNNTDMEVVEQGVYSTITDITLSEGGAAKEIYWLQFISKKPIVDGNNTSVDNRETYRIQLLDADGNELFIFKSKFYDHHYTWSRAFYIYSIRLKDVPIILLDRAKTISIRVR